MLHGEEHAAFGDAGYQGVHKKGSMNHCLHPRRVQSARAYKERTQRCAGICRTTKSRGQD